jgi:hypothetical protein
MDVIGHYFTKIFYDDNCKGYDFVWGTTFFLNDGAGKFKTIDAADAMPQLSQTASSIYKRPWADSRMESGAIIPLKNDSAGFIGLQLVRLYSTVSGVKNPRLIVQKFSSSQVKNIK